MQATNATYLGNKAGIRLIAAVLALAGSGAMVGGNLGVERRQRAIDAGRTRGYVPSHRQNHMCQ
jgi:hypothetical protein